MLYEIIMDCRIANKDYKKWDVVSGAEVEYFPSVMRPFTWETKPAPAPKVEEKKLEKVEDSKPEEPEDEEVEDEEKVEEKKEVKTSKKRSKKK